MLAATNGATTGRGGVMTGRGGVMTGRGGVMTGRGSVMTGRGSLMTGRGSVMTGRGGEKMAANNREIAPIATGLAALLIVLSALGCNKPQPTGRQKPAARSLDLGNASAACAAFFRRVRRCLGPIVRLRSERTGLKGDERSRWVEQTVSRARRGLQNLDAICQRRIRQVQPQLPRLAACYRETACPAFAACYYKLERQLLEAKRTDANKQLKKIYDDVRRYYERPDIVTPPSPWQVAPRASDAITPERWERWGRLRFSHDDVRDPFGSPYRFEIKPRQHQRQPRQK